MVFDRFGDPDVFRPAELPDPVPGDGQVLVRVLATSVNPVDLKLRRDGRWANLTFPALVGFDVAGIVEAVGPGVTDFAVGHAVFYTPPVLGSPGTYAEYHVVAEGIVARKPPSLSFVEAAVLPLAGCTAYDALVERAAIASGETVLVHAGAGGVGSLAVQIAKARGARVITTATGDGLDLARKLGADVAIDHRNDDVVEAALRETGGRGVDVAFDTIGGTTMTRTIGAMRPYGRVVGIVENVEGDLTPAFFKNLTIHFVFMQRTRAKIEAIRSMVEHGELRPVIDSVMPLERVADAHRRVERGGMRGKLALEVAQ